MSARMVTVLLEDVCLAALRRRERGKSYRCWLLVLGGFQHWILAMHKLNEKHRDQRHGMTQQAMAAGAKREGLPVASAGDRLNADDFIVVGYQSAPKKSWTSRRRLATLSNR